MRRRFVAASVRETVLAMLHARFAPTDERAATTPGGLLPFQAEAVTRLRSILAQRGGALLADSVGLGKTHVAAALVRETLSAGERVLITAPSVLAAHWRRHLRGARGWQWCSHAALSRGTVPRGPFGLVVCDEAHAFRNAATRRYTSLARACTGARLLMLTATPVNNSLLDLYHLLRLFAHDAAFRDVGVPDLRAAFDAAVAGGDIAPLRRVVEVIMVRRTRAFIRELPTRQAGVLRFPATSPVRVLRYELDAAYDGMLDTILQTIATLRFPAHRLAAGSGATALVRLSLLKRLESSTAALTASLQRQRDLLRAFLAAAGEGYLLTPREARHDAGGAQLIIAPALLGPFPQSAAARAALREAAEESRQLDALLDCCRRVTGEPKLEALRALLMTTLRDERVLVFSEYGDTAVHIARALRTLRSALIHGRDARLGSARSSRRTIIERFAPLANGVRAPPARERVDVLVTTDVLAEGLNLQDARVVVSYDLPWNPVRLAQRIGRIDRLGSRHASIEAWTFVPQGRVETLLGLMRRIRHKLRAIHAVGGDAPWLARRPRTLTPGQHAPAGDRDHPDWEVLERLRHACAPARPKPAIPGTVLVAEATRRGADEAAIVCIRQRGACRLYLVRDEAVSPAGAETDRALLAALETPAGAAEPDLRRARRAAATALAAAADSPTTRGRSRTPQQRAAAVVQRWLAERGTRTTATDCQRADRLLDSLRQPTDAATSRTIRQALRRSLALDEFVRMLEAALLGRRRSPAATPAGARESATARAEPVAVLLLRPDAPPVPPVAAPSAALQRPDCGRSRD